MNRSLHTWHNMLRLLCHAFQLETDGSDHKCEERLIHEAKHLNAKGKLIVPIIDDAHLLPIDALRKLRLLLEDFPKNHNLILFGQSALNTTLQLCINHDMRSRITYSAKIDSLAPHTITDFIHSQLDRVGLPHHTFTAAAANLIIRSSEGDAPRGQKPLHRRTHRSRARPHQNRRPQTGQRCPPPAPLAAQPAERTRSPRHRLHQPAAPFPRASNNALLQTKTFR
ncbi:ATP-binding protein [Luteolibacter sp. GHJ8]|uniref:ATP-binding protein n=1 Tax=Luteolibacter rhizosphaerae TaxID=2989719 RepID=A0ABT3G4J4_9BACT|nr:ATP-binding protein [Luteolibacter rhizosphaerae]MCW1914752.1 ATP-binding protein [Luteolibacter rhizosphaerae]